ncbi:branched-chain amino acid ABC transporter ATP-binding protein/permease [Nocardioides humi]|uniref:Branched-chain amino acid ABC transporter ATP-binding protein/permease n=1 Tax=Nocardioides humi TaxID=449461 RepID=A0ABN2A7Q3_9ACTN|nr:ATP-binding cassette domain-containing protein [Nocardioides humi]
MPERVSRPRLARRVRTSHGVAFGLAVAVVCVLVLANVRFVYAFQHTLLLTVVFGTAATAWGLFAGFGGQFSFGHAALFGLPSYLAVVIGEDLGIPPLVALVGAAALTALVTALVVFPALRLRGPYFALVTLALAELTRRLVNLERAHTGGEDGRLIADTGDGLLHLAAPSEQSYLVWGSVLLTLSVTGCWVFLRTRTGRELQALRDDPDVASTTGVDTTRVKLVAYVISAFLTGLAGGILAYSSRIIASDALLGPAISISILIFAGVGGMRSVFGPVIGAFALVNLEELLRVGVGAEEPQLYRITYAVLFALVLYFLPRGLASIRVPERVLRRLREEEPPSTGGHPDLSASAVRDLLDDLSELERRPQGDDRSSHLTVRGLTKRFGAQTVNADIDVEIPQGSCLAVWGHNGSGKSTLVNQLGGQLRPSAGQILVGTDDITTLPPHRRARLGIVRASQQARHYDEQTVLDNLLTTLYTTKRLRPLVQADHRRAVGLVERAVAAVGLPAQAITKKAGELSTGQRKKLELARVLVGHRPRVILLDEPTAGVDRAGVPQMAETLRALRDGTGATMVVVDHDREFLLALSTHVLTLAGGRVVNHEATKDLGPDDWPELVLQSSGGAS